MKLKFQNNAYVNGKLFAAKGEIKEVSNELGSADRWIKRGAIPVEDIVEEKEIKEEIKEEIDISKMKKKELLELAEKENVELPEDISKVSDIKEYLEKYLHSNSESLVEDTF